MSIGITNAPYANVSDVFTDGIVTGLTTSVPASSLTGQLDGGIAFVNGQRIVFQGSSYSVAASSTSYLDLNMYGGLSVSTSSTPSSTSLRLWEIVSGTEISSVTQIAGVVGAALGPISQSGVSGQGNQTPLLNVGDAFSDFIASGMQWTLPSPASLTSSMNAGVSYLNGQRTIVPAISSNTFPASSDTYVSFNNSGNANYASVANGATAPTVPSGYVQTAKVVTSPIISPTPTLSASTAAGTLVAGTYEYQLVAYDATGYGLPSTAVSITTTATGEVILTWVNPLNETSMSIYGRVAGSIGLLASGVTGTTWTDTGANSVGAAPPTSATSNAIQSVAPLLLSSPILSMGYTIEQFGAIGGGVDDTEAFISALNFMSENGGILYCLAPIYTVSRKISINCAKSFSMVGAGKYSTTIQNISTEDSSIFDFSGNPQIRLEGFTLYNKGGAEYGNLLVVSNLASSIRNICFSDYYIGAYLSGNTGILSDCDLNLPGFTTSTGIVVDGFAGGLLIYGLVGYEPTLTPSNGVLVLSCGGLQIDACNIIKQGVNLNIAPSVGQTVASVQASNCFLDSAQIANISISPNGGTVTRCFFTQCECSSASQNGIAINGGSGTVNGVTIVSAQTNFCSNNGILIEGSGVSNISIVGGEAAGNGGSGLSLNNSINNINVTSFQAGAIYGASSGNADGIYADDTVTNVTIINPIVSGNGSSTANNLAVPTSVAVFNPIVPGNNIVVDAPTSGSLTLTMSQQGNGKQVVLTFNAYENDTTTAQTINFPVAFSVTPLILGNNTGLTLTASTTGVTITAPDSTTTYSGTVAIMGN